MNPLHGGGGRGVAEGTLGALPVFSGLVLLLLALAALTALYLWQRGRALTPVHGPGTAEEEARRILAERFARGDMTSEEFLERSSTLNWTPGVQPAAPPPARRRRWPGW